MLTDGVVTLRAHEDRDLPRILELALDPVSRQNLPLPEPYGEADARAFLARVRDKWQDDTAHEWAVEGPDGRYAGSVNCHDRSPERVEIGYAAHPDSRGHGLVARAVRLVLDRSFADGVQLARWRCRAGNLASARVAWTCGFGAPAVVVGGWRGTGGGLDDAWHAAIRAGDPVHATRPWWTPAVLEGERVRLRRWRVTDRPATGHDEGPEGFDDRSQPSAPDFPEWLAAGELEMARGEGVRWCLADRASDAVLGHLELTGLRHPGHPGTGRLRHWLLPAARGRGLLGEALSLLAGHAFAIRAEDDHAGAGGLGLHRVLAQADLDDLASQRVLRRAGFREVALLRETRAATTDSPAHDEALFELLRTDDVAAQSISPLAVPDLETARVRLRSWREDDAPRVDDVLDADAARWVPERGIPTPQTFSAWLRRRRRLADRRLALNWCIADRATDRAMGNVTLFVHGDEPIDFQAELGYFLWPWARGRALLAEVVPVVLAHGFAPAADGGLGLTRIQAATDSDNLASRAVLLRAGFRQWGADHQAFRRRDGSLADGSHFELLAADRVTGRPDPSG